MLNVLKQLNRDWIIWGNTKNELCYFDFEIFPNYWLVVFHKESIGTVYVDSDDENYRTKIIDIIKGTILVGYNIKHFDLKILNAILSGGYSTEAIKELSDDIITNKSSNLMGYNDYFYWTKFKFIDLFDDMMGSLKEFESNNGITVKESDVDFEKTNLTKEDKEDVLKYCINDVLSTIELFESRLENYIKPKIVLGDMFGLTLEQSIKATNAKLVALVMNPVDITNLPTPLFKIPENVDEYLKEYVPEDILTYYTSTHMEQIDKFEKVIFDNKIIFGLGGLHSTLSDDALIVESNDDMTLYNIDVTSYYPNLIIHYNYMSRKVVQDKNKYADIYKQRLDAKREMKKHSKGSDEYNRLDAIQGSLKLVLNTFYGAMKNKYNKLFDFYQASNVCILGQLLLTALANELYNKIGAIIVQTNTDGILMYIKNERLEKAQEIVKQWEERTKLFMEWEQVEKFIQRDVNNYIEIKYNPNENDMDKKTKLKGKFCNQAFDSPNNLNAPITHKAIVAYYRDGIDIETTIKSSKDILDFCFTCKTGLTYDKTFHFYKGEMFKVNKVNRVIATTNKDYGTIKKYKLEDGKDRFDKQAEISDHSKIINDDISTYKFEDLEIDYNFYIDFTKNKLLEENFLTFEKNDPFI